MRSNIRRKQGMEIWKRHKNGKQKEKEKQITMKRGDRRCEQKRSVKASNERERGIITKKENGKRKRAGKGIKLGTDENKAMRRGDKRCEQEEKKEYKDNE